MNTKSTLTAALEAYIVAYKENYEADYDVDAEAYRATSEALIVARDVVKLVAIANGLGIDETYAALAEARATFYRNLLASRSK
jgi:hypothetical protein